MKSACYIPDFGDVFLHPTPFIKQDTTILNGVIVPFSSSKTKQDLDALIPELERLVCSAHHEIGSSDYIPGIGVENDYAKNSLSYDNDGWNVSIEYECCGEWYNHPGDWWNPSEHVLKKAWGRANAAEAYYSNDTTGEYREFTDSELDNIYEAIESALEESLIGLEGTEY
ncbi:MAG: hypothetical protein K2G90_05945 [Muribaculaceae bacterium]|nr:hypothetical protein [Muribaculaceae bacterium]